jgi:ribosomal RNA assembly protein
LEQYLKIPKDRIGAMIGPGGEVKHEIEKRTGIKVDVDSETGEVTIDYDHARDPAMVLKVNDLVKAIGRGFSPDRAFRLLKDEFYFALIDIHDYVGKNPDHVRRMKSRLIGTGGKTRRIIEELSEAELSIYGDTVAIIGDGPGHDPQRLGALCGVLVPGAYPPRPQGSGAAADRAERGQAQKGRRGITRTGSRQRPRVTGAGCLVTTDGRRRSVFRSHPAPCTRPPAPFSPIVTRSSAAL